MGSTIWNVAIAVWVGIGVVAFLFVIYLNYRDNPGRKFVSRHEWPTFLLFAAICALLGPLVAIVAVVDRYGTGRMR